MTELQRLNQQIADLNARRSGLIDQMSALTNRYRSADAWPEGASKRFDDLERAIDKVDDEIRPVHERREALITDGADRDAQRAAFADRAARGEFRAVTGDGALAAGQYRSSSFNVGTRLSTEEVYERADLRIDNDGDGIAYRDRALSAIDGWSRSFPAEQLESAARLVEHAPESKQSRALADHILSSSHPTYVRAFNKYLTHGPAGMPMFDPDESRMFAEVHTRAMNEGSVSAGQAIVPAMLDPTIMLTNSGVVNPFRQLATVKTITVQTWRGVTSAGVSAEWAAEAAESTDASPTLARPSITPVRGDAYIQASFEEIQDSAIAEDIAMLFADARERLEGAAFAVGTGSTQPFGVVTALQLTTASRTSATTNGAIGMVDIYALDNNLPARFRPNASFTMAKGIANAVRQVAIPSLTNFSPWVDFGSALPSKLIGYEVHEASAMVNALSAATASNDDCMILGDFRSGMIIVDRVPMTVAFLPIVIGPNRRPTGESGWYAQFRTGSDVPVPAAFQMLRV